MSPRGVAVIETKFWSGWIWAGPRSAEWKRTFPGGSHVLDQNPVHQNWGHCQALAGFLEVDPDDIVSVVFIAGDAEPKTDGARGPKIIYREGLAETVNRALNGRHGPDAARRWAQALANRQAATTDADRLAHNHDVARRLRGADP